MRLPKHIGVIPDGNRRWAKEHGFNKEDGYSYGLDCGLRFLRAAALSVWFSGHFSVCFSVACAWLRRAQRAALVFAKHTPRCQRSKSVIKIICENKYKLLLF